MKKLLSIIAVAALMISMLSVMLVPSVSAMYADTWMYDGGYYSPYINGSELYYGFTPSYSGYYTIEADSYCDSYVTLYDDYGYSLSSDDDSGDGNGFKLTTYLYAYETYYYGVRLYNWGYGTVYFSFYSDYSSGGGNSGGNNTSTERLFSDSLLPASASQFTCVDGGDYSVSVSSYGSGYKFTSDGGWPQAYFADISGDNMIETNYYSGDRLCWDFEVQSGNATILIYFCGQNPQDMAAQGTYVYLNTLIDPSLDHGDWCDDLPAGTYRGSISVRDLGYREDLMGSDYEMYISGIKVFAVGSTVIVNDVSIQRGEGTTTTTDWWSTTEAWTTTTTDWWTTTTTRYYPPYSGSAVTYSLLPNSASEFDKQEGYFAGEGSLSISRYGLGYRFTSDQGWPSAYTFEDAWGLEDSKYWVMTKKGSGSTLNYDFEVVSGAAAIIVYFCGQNPMDMASQGSFVSINGLVNSSYVNSWGETVMDIPVGKYSASVDVDDLGYSAGLLGDNGEMLITGVKVFAVGGEVIVNDISITDRSGMDNSHHRHVLEESVPVNPTTTTRVQTTTANPLYTTTTRPLAQHSSVTNMPVVPSAIEVGGGAQQEPSTTPTDRVVQTLLPASASDFERVAMGGNGNEPIYVNSNDYGGYTFSAPYGGWPCANYDPQNQSKWVAVNVYDENCYLNWDFTCTAGANIVVFFEGASPNEMATYGTAESINYYIDPNNGKYANHAVMDLRPGTYKGAIHARDLGIREDLIMDDGTAYISGIKIFAVGGEVIVRELSVGTKLDESASWYPTTTRYNPSDVVWMEKQTLLPASASDFETQKMGPNGNEPMYVNYNDYGGYTFSAPNGGWPCATYSPWDDFEWVSANVEDADCYLTWDFTCTGGANIVVYFEGANPYEQAYDAAESINYYIDPDNGKWATHAVKDLAPGTYKGSIRACDLGVREDLIREDGTVRISGIRVYAIGGEVIVRELAVGTGRAVAEVTPTTAAAANPTTTTRPTLDGDYIYYTVNSDGVTATIVDASIQTPGIRIPSVVGGKKVTAIADGAFDYENRLYSIEIPSSVTSIGDYAFYGCDNLVRVVLNQGAWQIGNNAFAECPKLGKVYYSGSPYQWDYLSIGSGNGCLQSARIFFDYAPYKTYPDVPKKAWYYEAVDHVSNYGLITGYASGEFGAVDNLQRQDFVVILARIAGADLSAYQGQNGGMRDVKAGSYYAAAVAWAVDNGIITGYKSGNFGVGDTITREQVCTIFYRYMGEPTVRNANATLGAYPDSGRVSPFARDAVAWAIQNGVISGTNGKIAPTSGASRAQIATIVMRMDQNGMLY